MAGFDVLLLLLLPLLLFSVFTFQSKGNLIIMLVFAAASGVRWAAGVFLLGKGS